MSAGVWNPSTDLPDNAHSLLLKWSSLGDKEKLPEIIAAFDETTVENIMPFMKQETAYWQQMLADYSTDQIRQLIYFFTLAEELHSALYAGNKSPVIVLNKMLKQAKAPLSKDDLLWIKQHSSNRFIPNGSINALLN